MNSRNRKFNRRHERAVRHLNTLIRKNCCWNCLQVGHLRFQCPYPKMTRCSFCRKPFVLSVNCNCKYSTKIQGVPAHQRIHESFIQPVDPQPIHVERVLVSVHESESDLKDNIVVCIENDCQSPEEGEEDEDILEISTETDFLNEI